MLAGKEKTHTNVKWGISPRRRKKHGQSHTTEINEREIKHWGGRWGEVETSRKEKGEKGIRGEA